MRINVKILSIITIVLIFVAKVPGLFWGFPAILHNDESVVIRTALGLRFGDLNPHHFDWPSLYFYTNYFFFLLFIKIRILLQLIFGTDQMKNLCPFWWGPELPFYLIGRIVTNFFLILCVVLTYFIAKKVLKNTYAGLLSTIIFLLGSWITYLSFYALSDIALTFWGLVVVYICILIIEKPKLSLYILAGFAAGIATSTKYNGIFFCLIILIAHFLANKDSTYFRTLFNKKIIFAGVFSLIGFFIGTPYAIINWTTFSRTSDATGAFWQYSHMGIGFNLLKYTFEVLPENFGVLIFIMSLIGLFYLFKTGLEGKLITITTATILILTSFLGIARAHYVTMAIPYLSISAVAFLFHIKKRFSNKLFVFLIIVAIIPMCISSGKEYVKRYSDDTRLVSGKWIEQNIPEGTEISSFDELTGYYGGNLPYFDYENYKVVTLTHPNLPMSKIFIANDKDISLDPNYDLIYIIDNKVRTGPNIYIFQMEN